jgi:hypothetical protein
VVSGAVAPLLLYGERIDKEQKKYKHFEKMHTDIIHHSSFTIH